MQNQQEQQQEAKPVVPTTAQIKAKWDMMSDGYEKVLSHGFVGKAIGMANMVRIQEANTILEVGCGDGSLTSEICLRKKKGAKLICADLSTVMCKKAYCRLQGLAELAAEPFGLFQVQEKLTKKLAESLKTTPDYKDGESRQIEALNAEVIQANIENLSTIESSSVDVYFAALTLMIVENTDKMLKEAFRVLKPSGRAIFSVWGETTHSYVFTSQGALLKKYGVSAPPTRSYFHLNDREKTIALLEAEGFKNVITWNQFTPWRTTSQAHVTEAVDGIFAKRYASLSPEHSEELTKDLNEFLNSVLREKKRPIGLDFLIIHAEKA